MRCALATTTPRRVPNQINTWIRILLLLLGLLSLPASLSAQTAGTEEVRKLLAQAKALEERHDWLEAWQVYEDLLRKDRTREDIRQAYLRCLRCYHIVHRHQDKVYRKTLAGVSAVDALNMYEQVLDTIATAYVDRRKTGVAALFREGLEELRLALGESIFRDEYFPGVERKTLDAFKAKLEDWKSRKIAGRSDARAQVMAVGRAAQQIVVSGRPVLLTVIILEFLSGACNALDEYTFFLTPGHFREMQGTLRGRLVSIGVDLGMIDGHLAITRVYPRSPAANTGLAPRDRIVEIDGESTEGWLPEYAAGRLRGKSGSTVDLVVLPDSSMMGPRHLRLKRRPVIAPSVDHDLKIVQMTVGEGMPAIDVPVGRLRITCFQESTLQEVKEALASLQTEGMKVLILDLRGNPGGLFKSAVQVAELFLADGVIVVSQTHVPLKDKRLSGTIRVESMNPLLIPLVVVIDGETASSAEVLAGALKDNGRARLIGQTTFGKGSIQAIIPLEKPPFDKMPGGIRITVAKLLSPNWQPYSGQGVQPDRTFNPEGDAVLIEAQRLLLDLLLKPMPMMPN